MDTESETGKTSHRLSAQELRISISVKKMVLPRLRPLRPLRPLAEITNTHTARPSSAEHCVPHKPRKLRQQHGAAPRRRVALREAASLNALVPDDCSDLDVFEPAVERVEPLQLPSVLGPHAPARRRPRTFWPALENVPEDAGLESVKPAVHRRRIKRTPLGDMIRKKNIDGVASTLAASPELLNRPCSDDGGLTPLMCAVLSGSRRMLRAVIRAGAPLDTLSSEGMTALDLARARGFDKAVGVLERQEEKRKRDGAQGVDAPY